MLVKACICFAKYEIRPSRCCNFLLFPFFSLYALITCYLKVGKLNCDLYIFTLNYSLLLEERGR